MLLEQRKLFQHTFSVEYFHKKSIGFIFFTAKKRS